MRAELPWNVAGIPTEAREAVRAAARREGLSVGEWLTRRILNGFSGIEEAGDIGASAPSPQEPGTALAALESRAISRDSDEMLARRSENESAESWRRIEEQLRGIGRRLDSSKRNHSESNRFLSRTAQEMNVNAREQAQAFEELGQSVRGLRERLERLERNAAGDNIREAIKALHQGLSRLADQLNTTTAQSAGQLAQVTANLEKLASHVGKVWEDADNTAQLLESRIDLAQIDLTQRLKDSEHVLDARLSATEKTVQFNTNALDHALEKIEAAAQERAAELAENQRRAAQHEEGVRELKDSLAALEACLPGVKLEARLNAIERSVGGLKETFAQRDPALAFGTAVQNVAQRLERLEREHDELIEALRAATVQELPVVLDPLVEEAPESLLQESLRQESALMEEIPEPPRHEFLAAQEIFLQEPAAQQEEPAVPQDIADAIPEQHLAFGLPHEPPAEQEEPAIQRDAADVIAEQHPAFALPPEREHEQENDIEPYPDFDDVFIEPEADHFLARARLSAEAASQQAEDERLIRLSAFHAGQAAPDNEERARPRYLIPALVAAVVMIMAVTALVLSQHPPAQLIAAAKPTSALPAPAAPPAGVQASALPLPQVLNNLASASDNNSSDAVSSIGPQAKPDATSATPTDESKTSASTAPEKPADKPAVKSPTPKSAVVAAHDRVAQLANAGNPVALAILGLKALDGPTVSLPNAVRFLTEAADKGQAVAQYRLGTLYERGQGVAADAAKAMHWYELAATQGNRKAMHNLAVAYASAPVGKRNMTEAARWFVKAANLGLSDSQFNLAVLYERGEGVPQSLADAYKWYAIAALSGDAEAKARMGVLETQLNASDRTAANKSATSFRAAPLIRSVNVPPEPADLGG